MLVIGSSSGQTRVLVITHANVIDVHDGRIFPNSAITISGDSITTVRANGTAPNGAREFDAQGKYVIASLGHARAHPSHRYGQVW